MGEAELRLLEPLRERIPARHEVVVSEDDEAGGDDGEVVPKPTEPRAPRDEVTGEADEIRLPLRNPLERPLDCERPARRDAQMEIGEVSDPQSVELRREPLDLDLEHAPPKPTRLEPTVRKADHGQHSEREEEPEQGRSRLPCQVTICHLALRRPGRDPRAG